MHGHRELFESELWCRGFRDVEPRMTDERKLATGSAQSRAERVRGPRGGIPRVLLSIHSNPFVRIVRQRGRSVMASMIQTG